MYAPFFGLKHEPFSIAPDPRYLFMSERHREALAHLLYGVDGGGGFVLLTGEIGAGKTTVCRCFLGQIPPHCNVAYIVNPKLTVRELLRTVCDEFGVAAPEQGAETSIKDYVDALNAFLLRTHAQGEHNVLVIDEAQALSAAVLEQLRLLTNLETDERKLLQIVLIGQPELRGMLARPELEQLAQRVVARFHLEALSEPETRQYVAHRWAVAGGSGPAPFEPRALRQVHRLARGVPRRINLLCDRALLGAYAQGLARVDARTVARAAREVFDSAAPPRQRRGMLAGALGAAALALAIGLVLLAPARRAEPLRAASASAASAPAATLAASATAAAASAMPDGAARADAEPLADPGASLDALPRSPAEAWTALGAAWGLRLDGADPCEAARAQQVHCYRSALASLALIGQLDRPGLLTVYGADAQPGYARLVGLDGVRATLQVGEARFSVPRLALAERWRGEFATLWRVPPGYVDGVVEGGASADWLAERLAALRAPAGEGAAAAPPLAEQVQAFQRAQGLQPDGLAGPVTLMLLNRAAGVDEPRLHKDR